MKKILLIATGGTIASKKTENGLTPQITPEELLSYIPQIKEICQVETVQPFNIDSTNMEPKHWCILVKTIRQEYQNYDGFVIAHGTDTMAYTAAALSYMIQNSDKPIVITGAQRPINMDITDAKTNLWDSFLYAADSQSQGVQIVFDGKVIAGTRAKKIRSKSYNAFSSIDFPCLAMIQNGKIMRYIPMEKFREEVNFYENLEHRIFLLKLTPGMSEEILQPIFEQYQGIIVESFGVGGIPHSLAEAFYRLCKKYPKKAVVMATQVVHEGSDMTIYQVGNEIKKECNLLESYDMTLEAVLTKIMWILGNPQMGDVRKQFYKPINYDSIVNDFK